VVLALAGSACGSKQTPEYAGAAVTLAAGVAGAGIYRATSGGCWGQCLDGTVCDRPSGRCVRVEEREDPRAPHLVRVNCLAAEPDCKPTAAAAAADEPKSETERARELADVLLQAPAIELRGHTEQGCRALAAGGDPRTLQDMLRTRLAGAEQRGSCAKDDSVSHCTLTLRQGGSGSVLQELELRFDLTDESGRETVVRESLRCTLAP